jgi:uncharacterized protein (DUF433 family)
MVASANKAYVPAVAIDIGGFPVRFVISWSSLDWSQCPVVESIPGKRSGAWVFKDTRMPVSTVFENLESGASIEESWGGST